MTEQEMEALARETVCKQAYDPPRTWDDVAAHVDAATLIDLEREVSMLLAAFRRVAAAERERETQRAHGLGQAQAQSQGESDEMSKHVTAAAIKWWRSHRPVGWDEAEHLKYPCVNVARGESLALEVASFLQRTKSKPKRKKGATRG